MDKPKTVELVFHKIQIKKNHVTPDYVKTICKKMAKQGFRLESMEGKLVLGLCESCYKPICEGDDYHQWGDGIATCLECGGPEKKENIGELGLERAKTPERLKYPGPEPLD